MKKTYISLTVLSILIFCNINLFGMQYPGFSKETKEILIKLDKAIENLEVTLIQRETTKLLDCFQGEITLTLEEIQESGKRIRQTSYNEQFRNNLLNTINSRKIYLDLLPGITKKAKDINSWLS